jgi:hypothetical protein
MAAHPLDFPLLDNYNRTNTGPPAGPIWANGTFWGDSSGLRVVSNQLATSGSGYRCDYTTRSYSRSNAVGHRFKVATPGTGTTIAWLLATTSPNGYALRYDGAGSNELLRYSGGSSTWLGGWTGTWSANDEFCIIADNDSHVTVWSKSSAGEWTKRVDVTDNTYNTTFQIAYTINDTTIRLDDLYGGAPKLNSLIADFESFDANTNPSGVATSGTSWHRVNTNRTLIVTDHKNPRRGTRSCWIERQAGDIPNPPNNGNRTEFYDGRAVLENSNIDHDAYYAVSFYLPDGSESALGRSDPAWDPEDDFGVIWQIHQKDTISGSPPIGLHADRYWDNGNDVSLYLHIRGGNPASPSTQDLFFTWDEEIRGQWIDLIFRIKFSTTSTGLVQGWIRRESDDDFTAVHDGQPGYIYGTWTNIPTAYTGDDAGYRKGGIYIGKNKRQTIYHHGYGRFYTFEDALNWYSDPEPEPEDPGVGPAAIHYSYTTAPTTTGWGGNSVMAVSLFGRRVHGTAIDALRNIDTEVLEYVLVPHDYPGTSSGDVERDSLYTGGVGGGNYNRANIPTNWYWDPANPSRVNVPSYSGYLMDMREGSDWVAHLLDWFDVRMNTSGWNMDGWFLDVLGDDYIGFISGFANTAEQNEYKAGVRDFIQRLRDRLGDEVILVCNNTWTTTQPINGICVENHTGANIGNAYWLAQLSRHDPPLGRLRNITLNGNLSDVIAWSQVAGVTHAAYHSNDSYQIAPTPPFISGGIEVKSGTWPDELNHFHLWAPDGPISIFLNAGLSFSGTVKKAAGKKLSATLSHAGSVGKAAARKLTGALSFSGSRKASISRKLSGSISPAGTLPGKGIGKTVEAEIAPSGAMSRVLRRSLSAGLSFSGSITPSLTLALLFAATLWFSGSISRETEYNRGFGALLDFSGNLNKRTSRLFSNTLSFTGLVNTLQTKVLQFAANLSFSGDYSKELSRTIEASLTPTSSFERAISKILSATLTFSGSANALKTISLVFTSALGFSGAITDRIISKKLEASITPASTALSRALSRTVNGSLGFSGNVEKTVNKHFNSALSFTGSIVKSTMRKLNSTLSFNGSIHKNINKVLNGSVAFAGNVFHGKIYMILFQAVLNLDTVFVRNKRGEQIRELSARISKMAKPVAKFIFK